MASSFSEIQQLAGLLVESDRISMDTTMRNLPEAGKLSEYGFPWKVSGYGQWHGFLDRKQLYGSGMAIAPWQSAPGVATALLKGRSHRTTPEQDIVDSQVSHR